MPSVRLNLCTADGRSEPIAVPAGKTLCSIQSHLGTGTWSAAVVELKWGNRGEGAIETWSSFSPTVTLTTSATSKRGIGVSGCRWLLLQTTTAESGLDADAIFSVEFF
jgi:hypothetical protein